MESPQMQKKGPLDTVKDTMSTIGGGSTQEMEKRFKEQEKKITKLRNDK